MFTFGGGGKGMRDGGNLCDKEGSNDSIYLSICLSIYENMFLFMQYEHCCALSAIANPN